MSKILASMKMKGSMTNSSRPTNARLCFSVRQRGFFTSTAQNSICSNVDNKSSILLGLQYGAKKDKRGIALENQPYPHLCVPNSTLLEYRQLEGRQGFSRPDILNRAWRFEFPEWTSNAANLWIKLPRPRPQCFKEVQRAALTEIADVTRAVCQTHRLPLALTWIPWGRHDDILKSGDSLALTQIAWLCELAIERTACYADEEMQGFVHACEQLFLNTGQEFFLPILVKESSEQQDLVEKLKLTIKQTCKSLTMCQEKPAYNKPSIRKRGSKVSKNNDKIEPAPDPDGISTCPMRLQDVKVIVLFKEGKPDSSLVSIDVRFDSHGMQMSKYLENADDPSKCISFAKRHRIKENYMSDLLCCEKAFVPVFDKDRSHFFLFVLQLKTQVVEIWDSLAASCQSDWVDRRLHNLVNGCILYELP
ncbi:hypothetical protein D5086_030058 [Populus alba]|uniref:Uncharacterized protein n=1 Tax=Populus alba TaxID=43335 RepID=A0ACC4AMI1_POPAL